MDHIPPRSLSAQLDGVSRLRERAQSLGRKYIFELPLKVLVKAGALCQANARAGVRADPGDRPWKKPSDTHLPGKILAVFTKE